MERIELVEVPRLGEEVRLLAERPPELLHHFAQVDNLLGLDEACDVARERAHDVDVLRHDLLGAGALHLHGDVLARHEARPMHLRERRGAQRVGIDGVEDLPELVPVFRLQAIEHHRIRHRIDLRAQAAQLIAVALGQDLGTVGENLPHLHEHGAEFLEHAT